jgi:SAM-dependent methyltransferase
VAEAESPYIPLPGNYRVSARETFDRVADLYDAARPGYPPEVFADLRATCGLGSGTRVLEVGCGSGQATGDLAELGCIVHCVELGPALAARAARNLSDYPDVRVEVGAFEEVELPVRAFDVVFSATAFHWVDPAMGFPRAAAVVRPGGFLALVTNAHVGGGTQELVANEIQDLRCTDRVHPSVHRRVRRARLRRHAQDAVDLCSARPDPP